MARARLHCIFVLLLYSQKLHGQPALNNNQNIGVNNAVGLQPNQQRTPRNFNSNQNGDINGNLSQQANLQANPQSPYTGSSINHGNMQQQMNFPPNLQQPPYTGSSINQGNMQQQMNFPPNLQSQTSLNPQNNFQITKIGFTPVTPGVAGNPSILSQQFPNGGVKANVEINNAANPIANTPFAMSNLAELAALKGQSLLSMMTPQNNCQPQQNQQIIPNQNQLTDAQKQYLVRTVQGQNQQGINVIQTQPRVVNMDSPQAITIRAVPQPQQSQTLVTPLGTQPAYITVQAQPLSTYLQTQMPQVIVQEEPSMLSMILSELGPQYAVTSDYTPPKKGSKSSLKALIPLILSLLKEKHNCGCPNCGCPNNCQTNDFISNVMSEPPMAEIFGGYSNQKDYSKDTEKITARIKKNDDEESRNNDKEVQSKRVENLDSEEASEEDDSEYIEEDE